MPALGVLFRTRGIWIHHKNTSAMSVCSCQKTLYSPRSLCPWGSFSEIPRNHELKEKKKIKKSPGWSPSFRSSRELFTIIVCVLCIVVDSICLGRRSVLSVSLPFLFRDNINHTPMFYPFFSFCFLFLHLSWVCSAVFLPCLSPAVLWQLLKGCLSWGTDPRTKTRPRPSTGAPCVRSPLAVMLIFNCLHSLPSCPYGDIPKEESLILAVTAWDWQQLFQVSVTALKLRLTFFFAELSDV